MKYDKKAYPLGMISAVIYYAHVFLGQALWKEYNPVTTDISSLTAKGAPNANLLQVFTLIYGICFTLFAIGMLVKAIREYHLITKIGYAVFLAMAIVSVIGYALFPLTGDKTEMSFQNMMHIVVTVIVVFTTLISLYLIAVGYLKKEKIILLGRVVLLTAVLITVFGGLNPIGMANNWNILGLTERMVIFTLQAFVFYLSFMYTFKIKEIQKFARDKN